MSRKVLATIGVLVLSGLALAYLTLDLGHEQARVPQPPGEIVTPPQPGKAPTPGSSVHLRTPSFSLSLHPLKMADVESRQVAALLHGGLVFQDDEGIVHPVLAESWQHVGSEWRFSLKAGVTYSDGAVVKAADVVTSICNAMQPTSPWAWALASISREPAPDGKTISCSGVRASGEREIILVEDRPSKALLDALGGPAGWIVPPEAKEQPYGVVPGIGPYKVREIVADDRVALEARQGGAIDPRVEEVVFRFLPDDSMAASAYLTGQIDVLDLTSPQLVELVLDRSTRLPKGGGTLQERSWDRVRILIVNRNRLVAKGFSQSQAHDFISAYSAAIDRNRIADLSKGTAVPLYSPFPPVSDVDMSAGDAGSLPLARLTILTEPDAYSDLIAASLPKSIGNVSIDYKGTDKAVLIDSLINGEFDIASILVEATVHSAEFWRSFFTPGNPFTVFGTPIEGIGAPDLQSDDGLQRVGQMIAEKGNWIGVLRERRLQAARPGVSRILFSPSGQTNFSFVTKN